MRGQSPSTVASSGATHLISRVGGHVFAVPIGRVRQVHRAVAVADLPGAAETVIGVVNVHGDPVPVLDLRRRLGLDSGPIMLDDALVLVEVRGLPLLVLVDEVVSLADISPEVIRQAEDVLPGLGHLHGITATASTVLTVHDVDTFLGDHEVLDLRAALALLDQPVRDSQ